MFHGETYQAHLVCSSVAASAECIGKPPGEFHNLGEGLPSKKKSSNKTELNFYLDFKFRKLWFGSIFPGKTILPFPGGSVRPALTPKRESNRSSKYRVWVSGGGKESNSYCTKGSSMLDADEIPIKLFRLHIEWNLILLIGCRTISMEWISHLPLGHVLHWSCVAANFVKLNCTERIGTSWVLQPRPDSMEWQN